MSSPFKVAKNKAVSDAGPELAKILGIEDSRNVLGIKIVMMPGEFVRAVVEFAVTEEQWAQIGVQSEDD